MIAGVFIGFMTYPKSAVPKGVEKVDNMLSCATSR
jgi:hypothetical protein